MIAFQRGGVQKVSGTSLTVKSNDGFVETYVLSDNTNVRENGDKAKLSDIDTSDRVLVVATKDGSTLNARRVIVRRRLSACALSLSKRLMRALRQLGHLRSGHIGRAHLNHPVTILSPAEAALPMRDHRR